MTNLIKFHKMIIQIAENFSFELSEEYLKLLLNFFKKQDISDEKLECCVDDLIISTTREDWNKKFGYGGKPAIADWLSFLGKKVITPEQMAILELSTVKEIARKLTNKQAFMFENGVTNAVIEELGGLRKIQLALLSDIDISYFDNQFKKTWLAFHEVEKESKTISGYLKFFSEKRKENIEVGLCEKCYKYNCLYEHLEINNPITIISNQFARGRILQKNFPLLSDKPIGSSGDFFSIKKSVAKIST